jgi:hypothetical protein
MSAISSDARAMHATCSAPDAKGVSAVFLKTFYWFGGPNETTAFKIILIIVNSATDGRNWLLAHNFHCCLKVSAVSAGLQRLRIL